MKLLKKIKQGFLMIGIIVMMLPSKVYAAIVADEAILYGPPEDFKNEVTNLEPDKSFIIKCIALILVPIFFIIGLVILNKKSKGNEKTKNMVTIVGSIFICFVTLMIVLFIVGHFVGWFE